MAFSSCNKIFLSIFDSNVLNRSFTLVLINKNHPNFNLKMLECHKSETTKYLKMAKFQINTKSRDYQRDKEAFLKELKQFNDSKK